MLILGQRLGGRDRGSECDPLLFISRQEMLHAVEGVNPAGSLEPSKDIYLVKG